MATEAPNPPIRVGDRVTWTSKRVTHNGSRISLSTVEGTVKELIRELAIVKPLKGGKHQTVLVSRLTPAGQKSEIGRIFDAVAANVK